MSVPSHQPIPTLPFDPRYVLELHSEWENKAWLFIRIANTVDDRKDEDVNDGEPSLYEMRDSYAASVLHCSSLLAAFGRYYRDNARCEWLDLAPLERLVYPKTIQSTEAFSEIQRVIDQIGRLASIDDNRVACGLARRSPPPRCPSGPQSAKEAISNAVGSVIDLGRWAHYRNDLLTTPDTSPDIEAEEALRKFFYATGPHLPEAEIGEHDDGSFGDLVDAIYESLDICNIHNAAYSPASFDVHSTDDLNLAYDRLKAVIPPEDEMNQLVMRWAEMFMAPSIKRLMEEPEEPSRNSHPPQIAPQVLPAKWEEIVVLGSRFEPPLVMGKRKKTLRTAGYNVLKALIGVGPSGCDLKTLQQKSGHEDAHKIMARLIESDPDFAAVLFRPGVNGQGLGYRIRFPENAQQSPGTPTGDHSDT